MLHLDYGEGPTTAKEEVSKNGLPFNYKLASSSIKLQENTDQRHGFSTSVPSSRVQRLRKWIGNPVHLAIFLFMTCLVTLGVTTALVQNGVLNDIMPEESTRNVWVEANTQTINALFTLPCLYQHPARFWHLTLWCRWKMTHIYILRNIYCKDGTAKPHERVHIAVMLMLGHLNCFAQYGACVFAWGYKEPQRPKAPLALCILAAIASGVAQRIYYSHSPLGKDCKCKDVHEEAQEKRTLIKNKFLLVQRDGQNVADDKPEWRGGLFDMRIDVAGACLSTIYIFSIFGWNVERLGFGNMFCQAVTFFLFCSAPFVVFNLAAMNIDNDNVQLVLCLIGVVLSLLGLLYGGFWRIQMRKRYNLPNNSFCCGKPEVADCLQWLFCCCCSLAQEVRTADFYYVVERDEDILPLSPLPREGAASRSKVYPSSLIWKAEGQSPLEMEDFQGFTTIELSPRDANNNMEAPFSPKMQRIEDT